MKQFTNLYQLTKTLKFKLEPQGETEDAEITKIRNYCIIGTIVINVLFAFLAFVVLNCKFLHLKVYTVYLLRRFSAAKI